MKKKTASKKSLTGKPYKMFVWDDVLADYTSGIIVVHARSLDEARELVAKEAPWKGYFSETDAEPSYVLPGKGVAYCSGGG